MPNLPRNIRPSSNLQIINGRRGSKPDGRCKKHPKHRQSPGVCSLCLKERLSQLSAASSFRATSAATRPSCSTSSSLSSYYSSSSASSCSSPALLSYSYRFGRGDGTEGSRSGPMSFVKSANNVLNKSRSLAFVPRSRRRDGGENKKKASGFWSKLLLRRPTSKPVEDNNSFMQSRTVGETTRVH